MSIGLKNNVCMLTSQVKLGDELGSGTFGKVFSGIYHDPETGVPTPCAVKAVKEEDTGARTMIVILALGCAAGSGFLAGKGGGAAPAALLGGEHPTPHTVSKFSQFWKIFQAWPSSAPAPGSATRRSRCRPSAQLFNESYLCNSASSHLDVNYVSDPE